jgi:hypothetical protein
LQQNKHNEQQSLNHEILKNLSNAREKPKVGKPNEKEILLALGKIYQHQQYIYNQEK